MLPNGQRYAKSVVGGCNQAFSRSGTMAHIFVFQK